MSARRFLPAVLVLLGASASGAQQAPSSPSLAGYSPAAAARQRAAEAAAVARPSPERAARLSRELSREPHVAGTPAQTRTRDYVIAQMKAMGLETEVRGYDVWMPHPTSVRVWR
ncbi:MAG: hypothetical protein ACJ79S_06735, partial [Gemmatimonadaceae bacterium]